VKSQAFVERLNRETLTDKKAMKKTILKSCQCGEFVCIFFSSNGVSFNVFALHMVLLVVHRTFLAFSLCSVPSKQPNVLLIFHQLC